MRPEISAHAPDMRRVRAWTVGALVSGLVAAASMAPARGAVARAVPSPGGPQRTGACTSVPLQAFASAFTPFATPRAAGATGGGLLNGQPARSRTPLFAAAGQASSGGPERLGDAVERAAAPRTEPPLIAVQAGPSNSLPSLVLPPAVSTEPPLFTSLMRMGDAAMVRGDVTTARALYERAASVHPASPAAFIAAGKTYDPNTLSLLNMDTATLADTQKARAWYERARSLGDPAAASLLAALR